MINEKIGFWGYPDPNVVENIKQEYPNAEWVDLSEKIGITRDMIENAKVHAQNADPGTESGETDCK